ncbi:dynein regulatory complex protein 1 [Engraulis encrasicolus]|uniref:dynein regulatory complex protein 1 n=1 Tax=Engraulis encrasicolus TaxID=184585 RepID=UPI002FCED14C
MSLTCGNHPNGDDATPSVLSENREDRIAARRLRIAARTEARKRQDQGEDVEVKVEVKEETKSQRQVELSERRIQKLQGDGTELVTNIQVAADARESQRRDGQEDARRLRLEKLEGEAKCSLEKFEEISKKWSEAKVLEIPQELKEALKKQSLLCAALIQDKNKLIHELAQELKESDDRYVRDLKRQADEVDLMVERMEEQIKILIKSYREEQQEILTAFEEETKALLEGNLQRWEQMRRNRGHKEAENLRARVVRVEEFEDLLQKLRVEDAEEYSMIKSKLENDVQVLQQQLQQMKATYQLNQEKLEYNFQVLKKRDEENTITKSQQKRKITRLQDILNNLKIKCSTQEKQSCEENQSQTEEYRRIMQQFKHMQKKMRRFAVMDAQKFEEVWRMNDEEVKALASRALEIDRLIHQQQLGLEWAAPPLPFMQCSDRPVAAQQRQSVSSALQAAVSMAKEEEVVAEGEPEGGMRMEQEEEEGRREQEGEESTVRAREGLSGEDVVTGREEGGTGSGVEKPRKVSPKTIKRILELLCDEAGFLIEGKLQKLLSPLEKNEQSLMRLDSIFAAMNIDNEEDVYQLADFFSKFKKEQAQEEKKEPERGACGGQTESAGDEDLMHPNDFLTALKAFTALHGTRRESVAQHKGSVKESLAVPRSLCVDPQYWEGMAGVISPAKLIVWGSLEKALEKYHGVLTDRSKLLVDTQKLRQQNLELKSLLRQYVNSRVNAELEIPPTQVMQIVRNDCISAQTGPKTSKR